MNGKLASVAYDEAQYIDKEPQDIAQKALKAAEHMTNQLAQDLGPMDMENAQELAKMNSFIESLAKMVAHARKLPDGKSLRIQVGDGDKKITLSWMRNFLHDIGEPQMINKFKFIEVSQLKLRQGNGFKTYSAKTPSRKGKKGRDRKSTWKGKKPDRGEGGVDSKTERSTKDSAGSSSTN